MSSSMLFMLDVLKLLASYLVVSIISATVIAYIARKVFENWLSNFFKKRLQELQFEQSKEIDRLKGSITQEIEHVKGLINAQVGRTLRLHQYEFETLPRLWSLLNDAYEAVTSTIASFDQYPNLNSLDEEQLVKFAKSRNISEQDTQYLLDATDKLEAYRKIRQNQRVFAAKTAIWELRSYTQRNKLFWIDQIRKEVDEIVYEMDEIWVWQEIDDRRTIQNEDFNKLTRLRSQFVDTNRSRLKKAETLIKERLNLNLATRLPDGP